MVMSQAFFSWKEDYSVNIKEIDDQHKKIIEMLNVLYIAFMKKEHQEKLEKIIVELGNYAVYHFATEEKYFREFKFSGKMEHINEHVRFREKVSLFSEEFQRNNSVLTFSVINFLKDWLNKHILIDDKKYMKCFSENGLR
jgi:hemerythrin